MGIALVNETPSNAPLAINYPLAYLVVTSKEQNQDSYRDTVQFGSMYYYQHRLRFSLTEMSEDDGYSETMLGLDESNRYEEDEDGDEYTVYESTIHIDEERMENRD